ncbi:MAG: hypothetical protein RBT64_12920 [Trichloromonas sp.]|nr:hypothetical protein [Trichloromonas sp.]
MVRVVCSAKCKHNQGGRCRRSAAPGEPVIRLDQRGSCMTYRPA